MLLQGYPLVDGPFPADCFICPSEDVDASQDGIGYCFITYLHLSGRISALCYACSWLNSFQAVGMQLAKLSSSVFHIFSG